MMGSSLTLSPDEELPCLFLLGLMFISSRSLALLHLVRILSAEELPSFIFVSEAYSMIAWAFRFICLFLGITSLKLALLVLIRSFSFRGFCLFRLRDFFLSYSFSVDIVGI